MEKIKKYNQVLLAVTGTLSLLFLLGIGVHFVSEYISYNRNYPPYEPGIISEETADSLIFEKKRDQILTFDQFQLIDTLKNVYLIPVGQRNLNESESTGDLLGLVNVYTRGYDEGRFKYGIIYNNLILFEPQIDKSTLIFDRRISISDYTFVDFHSCLIIQGAEIDSNKDGYIDGYDVQQLYLYDLEERKLDLIKSNENLSLLQFAAGIEQREMVFQFGQDRDKNGEFEDSFEPKVFFKLNMEKKKLQPVISKEQLNQIQKLLEGNKLK